MTLDRNKTLWAEGNCEEYEADNVRRLGAESIDHRRVKYTRLTR